jgi:DNA-dependent RNA polymerase auxiliary subunit epsilon
MKVVMFLLILPCFSVAVSAEDSCSNQVNGYLMGLETVVTLVEKTEREREALYININSINRLRQTMPDCKVIEYIPELKASRAALEYIYQK